MLNKLLPILLACLALSSTQAADSLRTPASVIDCLLSLPADTVAGCSRKEREKALKQLPANDPRNVVDEKNGYIHIAREGKSAKDTFNIEVALFPSPDDRPIVGVHAGTFFRDCWPKFYQWSGGKWSDVTAQVVPAGVYKKYGFDLPRRGTTVDVRVAGTGEPMMLEDKVAFRMKWKEGKFAK